MVICTHTLSPAQTMRPPEENYASVCIASHNISLAGAAEGLAVTWETGGVMRHPKSGGIAGG